MRQLTVLLPVVSIAISMLASAAAYGQSSQQPADLPTHRRLEISDGELPDIPEQARLLQQLRDLVSPKPAADALPLSEQQLQQMERIFKRWQAESGNDFKLPDLDSIPKEWIDQAIANPQVRKQAEQIIERYARERQNQQSSSPASNPSGFPPFPGADGKLGPDGSVNEPSSGSENRSDAGAPSTMRPLTDANKVKALQDLLKQLTETQEKPRGQTSPNNRNTQSQDVNRTTGSSQQGKSGTQRDLNSKSNSNLSRTLPNNSPMDQQAIAERLKAMEALREAARLRAESARQRIESSSDSTASSDLPENDSKLDPNANDFNLPNNPDSELNRSSSSTTGKRTVDSSSSSVKSENPFENSVIDKPQPRPSSSNRSNSNRASNASELPSLKSLRDAWQAGAKTDSDRKSASSDSTNSNSGGSKSSSSNSARSSGNAAADAMKRGSDLDVKSQIERHGLGETLRRIVEKTVAEQSNNSSKPNQTASRSTSSKPQESTSGFVPAWKTNEPTASTQVQPKVNQPTKNSTRSPENSSANSQPRSATNEKFREFLSDVWKSISTVNPVDSSGTTANSPTSNLTSLPSDGLSFSGANVWWLLLAIVAASAVFILLFAGRRMQLVANANAAEAAWVQEILRAGVKTRADIVRAFHHFVLGRPQPAANWWNHRFVAKKITESSPHLRAAIQELTNLYELARYQPPDVELSPEQLQRAQSVLKQCEA